MGRVSRPPRVWTSKVLSSIYCVAACSEAKLVRHMFPSGRALMEKLGG